MRANVISVYTCNEYWSTDGKNLYWKKLYSENCRNGKAVIGQIAGCFHRTTGYHIVRLGGKRYQVHRILYQMYNNIELKRDEDIDHINLDKTDNRKENLRHGNNSENQCNRKVQKNNKSTGIKNIYIAKSVNYTYYRLCIKKNGIDHSKLYRIDKYTLEEVIKIRDKMLQELHGEFASFG